MRVSDQSSSSATVPPGYLTDLPVRRSPRATRRTKPTDGQRTGTVRPSALLRRAHSITRSTSGASVGHRHRRRRRGPRPPSPGRTSRTLPAAGGSAGRLTRQWSARPSRREPPGPAPRPLPGQQRGGLAVDAVGDEGPASPCASSRGPGARAPATRRAGSPGAARSPRTRSKSSSNTAPGGCIPTSARTASRAARTGAAPGRPGAAQGRRAARPRGSSAPATGSPAPAGTGGRGPGRCSPAGASGVDAEPARERLSAVPAPLVERGQPPVGGRRRRWISPSACGHGDGQRLLLHQVPAGPQRGRGQLEVHRVRRRDDDQLIAVVGEQRGRDRRQAPARRQVPAHLGQVAGHDRAQPQRRLGPDQRRVQRRRRQLPSPTRPTPTGSAAGRPARPRPGPRTPARPSPRPAGCG